MLVKNLFERDIFRPINGVVKADQLDDSSVWQELDEFVITRELDQHFRKFISWYLEALDQEKKPDSTGKMGIWISGFFGSGKSHFLKVLSYLLQNRTHVHDGESKQAVEFFESKVKDAMLFGDIKRAVIGDTDVILFNIDSKADHGSGSGRDLILRVFLKVLNELQGYSGDYPHIAHMERYLESKGKLNAFQVAYEKYTGLNWLKERDAYVCAQQADRRARVLFAFPASQRNCIRVPGFEPEPGRTRKTPRVPRDLCPLQVRSDPIVRGCDGCRNKRTVLRLHANEEAAQQKTDRSVENV